MRFKPYDARMKRAIRLQVQIECHTAELTRLARERRDVIVELVDSGEMTQSEIAKMLGVTRSRVSHILKS